jgi:hypothetical protein
MSIVFKNRWQFGLSRGVGHSHCDEKTSVMI